MINDNSLISKHSLLKFSFNKVFKVSFISSIGELVISIADGYILLDTTKSNNLDEMIIKTNYQYDKGNIEILLDTSSIEIFINDGKETMTSRYYFKDEKLTISYNGIDDVLYQNINVLKE